MREVSLPALIGLAPVLCFLGALVLLDSYKLVRLRWVVMAVVGGMAIAGIAYFVNGALLEHFDFHFYTRYVSPFIEETLKALAIVALVRAHRIGFLVDAAIFGFAVGAGFALVENLDYLSMAPHSGIGTWFVRGFGTAIMHGGATAIFAVASVALLGRAYAYIPGFALAVVLHSAFNHFFFSPLASTAGVAIVMPLLLNAVFARSETAVGDWLGRGFDADAEMLELINSGQLSGSPVGRYLHQLKDRFQGLVVADLWTPTVLRWCRRSASPHGAARARRAFSGPPRPTSSPVLERCRTRPATSGCRRAVPAGRAGPARAAPPSRPRSPSPSPPAASR